MLKKYIYAACVSKHDSNHEKQVIFLMISNRQKGWYYFLAVKNLSVLLRGIISKHYDEFYCLNCFHSFRTKKTNFTLIKSMQKLRFF